jgi:hypothetical protein
MIATAPRVSLQPGLGRSQRCGATEPQNEGTRLRSLDDQQIVVEAIFRNRLAPVFFSQKNGN